MKEIKKALENFQKNNCLDCPYFIDKKRCRANDLLLDTITFINELESENERLKNRITCKIVIPDDKLEEIKNVCFEKVELAKGELLKQFAERLKKKSMNLVISNVEIENFLFITQIDETLKEFINKGDDKDNG